MGMFQGFEEEIESLFIKSEDDSKKRGKPSTWEKKNILKISIRSYK